MKLINKIKSVLFGESIDSHEVPEYRESTSVELREKEKALYGDDKLAKQRLFEKWSVKEQWLLKSEAIPLILGLDPETEDWKNNEEQEKEINDLFEHARHCINQGMSLSVIDQEQEENQWQVSPTEFYCWASVSRVNVSEQLAALMEFVISTVKRTTFVTDRKNEEATSPEAASLSHTFNQETEKVLGAALAVLIKHPDDCKNSKGRVKISNITRVILENQSAWFDDKQLSLSQTGMEDLLNKWATSLDKAAP